MLSVGIIGLPNVGKSTLFNALTAGHANASVSNYPFTTIEANIGMVPVPDERLETLQRLLKPKESTPAFVQFTDIAGLVQGASRGEGLGNQFLGNIREVDAIAHVVRCFEDPNVAHVMTRVDPVRDVAVIETELLLADLEVLNRSIEKRERLWRTSPREFAREQQQWLHYREKLEVGVPLRALDLAPEERRELKGLGLLTGKPLLLIVNVSEEEYEVPEPECIERLKASQFWQQAPPPMVAVSAQIEWELQQLGPEERAEFMKELGGAETGLQRIVKEAFKLLRLITFYTVVREKLRAWEIESGTLAPQAAGKIHTDMEKGFIRAQVASFADLLEHGDFQSLHRLGLTRTEGKDYVVQDGDVIQFLFAP